MEKILLKPLADQNNKRIVIVLFTLFLVCFYTLSGHFQFGEIRYLPLSSLEERIPLIIESIWLYIFMYPFLIMNALLINNMQIFNKILYSFIITTIISLIIFQLIPVAYPREFYPLPQYYDFSLNLFYKIRFLDSPLNCFPSLHVSLCFLITFFTYHISKKRFLLNTLLSILISISTLTTKQHYIADIISAFILSFSVYFFIYKQTEVK